MSEGTYHSQESDQDSHSPCTHAPFSPLSTYGKLVRDFKFWSCAECCASGFCNFDALDDAVSVAFEIHGPLVELAGRIELANPALVEY
jgi:hypothetical protein